MKKTINIFLEKEKKKSLLKYLMEGEKVRKFEIRKSPGGKLKNSQSPDFYYGSSENNNTPDSYSSEENIARKFFVWCFIRGLFF